jgi:hypothetical protein
MLSEPTLAGLKPAWFHNGEGSGKHTVIWGLLPTHPLTMHPVTIVHPLLPHPCRQREGFITDVISQGKKKCAAVCKLKDMPTTNAMSGSPSTSPYDAETDSDSDSSAYDDAGNQIRGGGIVTAATQGWGGHGGASAGASAGGGPHKFRRLDLRLVPYDSFYYSTLYFTGSDELNKEMRQVAIEQGLKLSEYGLQRTGEPAVATGQPAPADPPAATSEEDIFNFLGMKYREPTARNL